MTRWLGHPLFAPVLVLLALGWGALSIVFLLVGPNLGPWATSLLTWCFGWNATTRAYRLDAVLLVTLQPPLFVLVVGFFYADELRAFLRRVGGRAVSGAAALGFVSAALGLALSGDVVGSVPPGPPPAPIREGRPAPRLTLTDHRGEAFELGGTLGRPIALTFIYLDCHATCPALVATLRSAEALAGDDARFAAVTLAPEEDTVPRLAAAAEEWKLGPGWRLLTGERATIDRLRQAWGIAAERLADGTLAHANVIVLLDTAGRVAYTYRGLGYAPADLARALAHLAAEQV